MKYLFFLWTLSIANCYAQPTNTTQKQQDFLYTSSINDVNRLWTEVSLLAHSSFMPKDISDEWPILEQIYNHTVLICTEFNTNKQQDFLLLTPDSLVKEYNLLSKDLSVGINSSFEGDSFIDEKMGVLQILTLLQNEKAILTNVRKRLQTSTTPLQLISYSVNASNQYIAESGWYIATIQIQAFGIDLSTIKVFVENKELPVVNGIAELKFKPISKDGKYFKDGFYEKKWTGKIVINNEKELVFPIEQTYYIAKPYATIQSASLSALYRGCDNEISIICPALGASYTPRYEISNPDKNRLILSKENPSTISIIPEDKKVQIKLYNDSLLIDSYDFAVRFIPIPYIDLRIGGALVGSNQIIKKQLLLKKLTLKLSSDESFLNFLPKDASFYAKTIIITLQREGKIIYQEEIKGDDKTTTFSLPSSLHDKIATNDTVKITAGKIIRKTFEKKEVDFIPNKEVSFEFIIVE